MAFVEKKTETRQHTDPSPTVQSSQATENHSHRPRAEAQWVLACWVRRDGGRGRRSARAHAPLVTVPVTPLHAARGPERAVGSTRTRLLSSRILFPCLLLPHGYFLLDLFLMWTHSQIRKKSNGVDNTRRQEKKNQTSNHIHKQKNSGKEKYNILPFPPFLILSFPHTS
jgi:hypothetical protein